MTHKMKHMSVCSYPVQWFMNVLPVLQRFPYSYISNLHVTIGKIWL